MCPWKRVSDLRSGKTEDPWRRQREVLAMVPRDRDGCQPKARPLRLVGTVLGTLWLFLPLSTLGTGIAASSQPIPIAPSAVTERDLARGYLKSNLRTMPEAYQQVGAHDPTWDELAIAFLESAARWMAKPAFIDLDDLIPQGAALQDLGCTDPMILSTYGSLLRKVGRTQDAEVLLRGSPEELVARGYCRFRAANAAANLVFIYRSLGGDDDPDAEKYFRLHLQYLNESLSDGSFLPDELPGLVESVASYSRNLYQGKLSEVYESLKSNPKADPYLVGYIGGLYHIAAAWDVRGGGWAYQVSDEGWESFDAHMKEARALLTNAWKLNPSLPHAPAQMITVEGATGEEGDARLWFDRAVAAQLDYIVAYDSLLWFMRPRWGGSLDEMSAFGLECFKTGRFDTDLPLMYARTLCDLTEELEGDTEFWRKPGVYERLEAMSEGYANAQPERSPWFRSIHAATTYRCGKDDQARELLDALGSDLDESIFAFYAGVSSAAAREKTGAKPVEPVAAEPPPGRRNVIHAFDAFTPAEEPFIFANEGTWRTTVGDRSARVADARQRVVYSFSIPESVKGAVLYVRIANNFAIAVAADKEGKPGEFHETLNAIQWLGRLCFNAANEREQVVDLTPYLADNPARTVYVALYSAYPVGGWGAIFTRIEVVAADADEQRHVDRLKRGAARFAEKDRAEYVLYFMADGGQAERQYIYEDSGSTVEAGYRELGGDAHITYRLPVSRELLGYSVLAWVQGDFVVSIAPDRQGKPGEFEEIMVAGDQYPDDVMEAFGNMEDVWEGLPPEILESGFCYLKFADGNPDNAARVIIRDVCL